MLENDLDTVEDYTTSNGPVANDDPDFYMFVLRVIAQFKAFFANDNARLDRLEKHVGLAQAYELALVWEFSIAPDPFYGAVWYDAAYNSAGYAGGVFLIQGWNHKFYCLNARTGAVLWNFTTNDNNYGRMQSAILPGDTFTTAFGASHDGRVYAINSDGTQRWVVKAVYAREGGNDETVTVGLFGVLTQTYIGGTNPTGLTPSASTATTVTVAAASWALNAFVQTHNIGVADSVNDYVYISAGLGAGTNLYVIHERDPVAVNKLKLTGNNHAGAAAPFPATDGTTRIQIIPRFNSDISFQNAGTYDSATDALYTTGYDNHCIKIDCLPSSGTFGTVVGKYAGMNDSEPWPTVDRVKTTGRQVLFAATDFVVRCLEASTMALNWEWFAPVGVNGVLETIPLVAAPTAKAVVVGEAWDNNDAAGRVVTLDGRTGVFIAQSRTTKQNIDGKPLTILRSDGDYDFVVANDGGLLTYFDKNMNVVWERSHDKQVFNSAPILADMLGDGVMRILAFDWAANCYVYSLAGERLATLHFNGGFEGINFVGDVMGNGMRQLACTSLDGKFGVYNILAVS